MRGELRGQDKDLKPLVNQDDENVVSAQQAQGKDQEDEAVSLEKQQEILLINKMAAGGKLPPKNQSMFLQKKLQQRKFFDSGDYAMNQNKEKKIHPAPPSVVPPTITQVSPTAPHHQMLPQEDQDPEQQLAEEQASQALPTLRAPSGLLSVGGTSIDAGDSDEEGQLQIPRPDTVPQRKASILHPSVHSKLSPAPHIHHEHNDESISAPPQ